MIAQQRLGLQQGLNAAGVFPGVGEQHWRIKASGQLRQAQTKEQAFIEGPCRLEQRQAFCITEQLFEGREAVVIRHHRPCAQLSLGWLRRAGLQRRQQGFIRKVEDLPNKAHIVIKQGAFAAVLLDAGGQWLAVAQRQATFPQLLHQAHHQGGLTAERFTGAHQERGAGVAHGMGAEEWENLPSWLQVQQCPHL